MQKQDYFNEARIEHIDYKDVETLRKFLTPHARIQNRKRAGTSSIHQRALATAVKRARFMGLLPYISR
ncbi:30S ribosomal protein S18 [Candidatus Parcubacteria bacterium]|nr:30S ribosomal protein S18 [Candidatus Parcubacteria bacterium]